MGISKEEAIKELQTREEIFVAYSQATKLPYVKCDEETFNDQAWIFSTEEGIKEFRQKNAGRKGSSYGYEIYQEGLSQIIWNFLCNWRKYSWYG